MTQRAAVILVINCQKISFSTFCLYGAEFYVMRLFEIFEPCQCVRQPYTTGIPERDGVFDTFFIYQISSLGQPGVYLSIFQAQ